MNGHKYYIRGHVFSICVLPLREQKQVIANYKILSPGERVAPPAASYYRSKKLLGSQGQDKSAGLTGATPQSQFTALNEQGNG